MVTVNIENFLAGWTGYGLWDDGASKHPFDSDAEVCWDQSGACVFIGDALKEGGCTWEAEAAKAAGVSWGSRGVCQKFVENLLVGKLCEELLA